MIKPVILEKIASQFNGVVPVELLSQAIKAVSSKMELVSREEFDIQAKVLLRTREKIEALEIKVKELENNL